MNRAYEIIREARDGKFAASAFISREEFIILKFLRKYVLTLQAFSYISQEEKYANSGLYQSGINIKVFLIQKIRHGLPSRDIFQKYVRIFWKYFRLYQIYNIL